MKNTRGADVQRIFAGGRTVSDVRIFRPGSTISGDCGGATDCRFHHSHSRQTEPIDVYHTHLLRVYNAEINCIHKLQISVTDIFYNYLLQVSTTDKYSASRTPSVTRVGIGSEQHPVASHNRPFPWTSATRKIDCRRSTRLLFDLGRIRRSRIPGRAASFCLSIHQ